ncbi:MAG: chemotaxis protein CheC [Nanoarchaeota archaeon]
MKNLTDMEYDALKEVGNVGVGNAATALSKMLNKKVDIFLPDTQFVPLDKFADQVGGKENIVISLYLEITGGIKGETIFLFPSKGALALVDLMMFQEPGTTKEMDEMAESAFKEMANIFVGAYLNALANMMKIKIFPGVPNIANDMAQAVLDAVLIKISQKADEVLSVKTKINVEGYDIDGSYMMLFENDSLKIVIDKLKEQYGF